MVRAGLPADRGGQVTKDRNREPLAVGDRVRVLRYGGAPGPETGTIVDINADGSPAVHMEHVGYVAVVDPADCEKL